MLAARRCRARAISTFKRIAPRAAATPNGPEWRRFDLRSALVTTALGTGVLAVAGLWPAGAAMACVDVTTASNTVLCDESQTTTNTTDPTTALGDGFLLSDRNYLYTADGDIDVEITTDGVIDGYGLAVTTTEFDSAIIVEHQGEISVNAGNTPSEGGSGVFNLTTDGGDITYAGNGSVIDNEGGNPGLVIDTGAGAGNVNIGSVGSPVTPTYQGASALVANSGTGNQNIFLDDGTMVVTDSAGDGVFASSTNGDINIALTGNTQITTTVASPNDVWGMHTDSSGGATTISSDADMGSAGFEFDRGISSFSTDGPVAITQSGGTIMATGVGVFAESSGATGDISIATDAGSQIQMTGGTGIIADQLSAAGGATITVHGNIIGSDTGVSARITDVANADDVVVSASGAVQSLTGSSISATTAGTGDATVNLLDGADLQGGVLARSTTGNAGIVAGDDVTVIGNSPGMWSITAGGDAAVAVGDDALVTGSSGIVVDQASPAGTGIARVVVGDNGEIIGDGTDGADPYDGNGIFAGNQGTGETSVTTGTGTSVTGAHNGIVAFQTNAANTNDMTIITDGPVTGNGTDVFSLPLYTDAFDAAGLPTTGLGIGVANEGTGDIIVAAGDTVTGSDTGIQLLAAGGGSVIVTTDAAVEGTASTAILTVTDDGDITITANDDVTGGDDGILAFAGGTGSIVVTTEGVEGTASTAILTVTDDGDITITANDDVTGGDDGILAVAGGSGSIVVTTEGMVEGTAATGIVTVTTDGDITITANDDVTGGDDGILALAGGTGNIAVTTGGAVEGTAGDGIMTLADSGNTVITATADVTGADDGIDASSTTGSITIAGGGDITGDSDGDIIGEGIHAASTGGGNIDVNVTGDISGASGVVLSASLAGSIDLRTGGAVDGTVFDGINTVAVDGDTLIVTDAPVSASDSGIDASATGAGAISILANDSVEGVSGSGISTSAFDGDTAIETNGAVIGGGYGIHASATGAGGISILANDSVDGFSNDAIFTSTADGNTAIEVNGLVMGNDDGIDASTTGAGTISIVVNDFVEGSSDNGIVTSAFDGDTAIVVNGAVVGGENGIDATAGAGSIDVVVAGGAQVTGAIGAGVSTNTWTGEATIDNAGLIQGTFAAISGATQTVLKVVNQAGGRIQNLFPDIGALAISVTGTGAADIENDGTIRGRLDLDVGDDIFTNSGRWVTTGVSKFRGGNDSVINAGQVDVASQAAVAEITHFENLEDFTNASTGVIDMVDGNAVNAGDELTIDGVYTGAPGSIIGMDLALVADDAQAGSDLLILDGANPAQGTSDIVFNIVSTGAIATTADANRVVFAGGQLSAPVTVVENRGNLTTSSGDDIIPLARSGLITYDLVSGGGDFQVVSELDAGLAGGLLLPISATLANVAFTTQRTPNPITATCIDPDNKANAQGGWVRGLAGEFNTESAGKASTGGVSSDLESDNRTRFKTLQGGFDHVLCNLGSFASTMHFGVTVGQTWGDSFQKDPDPAAGIFGTDVAFDTFFVGPYAAFTRGNFAAQASLRYDYHSLELSNPTVGVDADGLDVDAEGISGSASMSYDFELATLTLTPDIGVNVSNTEIDSFDIAGGTIVLDDLWSVMGHAGVTARTEPLGLADNLFVVPFASATLYHEFIDHADGRFDIGGTVIESESNRVGTFGQLGIGANAVRLGDVVAGRPTLFGGARFDLQVGERIEGATATVFGRLQF